MTKQMTKQNYYIYGNRGDGYTVKRQGAKRASARTDTKAEAERIAKSLCREHGGGEVQIRRSNGQIMDSDTVPRGNDPCPPRDKVM